MRSNLIGQPVRFKCSMEKNEWVEVAPFYGGNILLEMFSPSQISMDENGQIALSRLDAENLAYTINQILEGTK